MPSPGLITFRRTHGVTKSVHAVVRHDGVLIERDAPELRRESARAEHRRFDLHERRGVLDEEAGHDAVLQEMPRMREIPAIDNRLRVPLDGRKREAHEFSLRGESQFASRGAMREEAAPGMRFEPERIAKRGRKSLEPQPCLAGKRFEFLAIMKGDLIVNQRHVLALKETNADRDAIEKRLITGRSMPAYFRV